jgi:hypothetical protein
LLPNADLKVNAFFSANVGMKLLDGTRPAGRIDVLPDHKQVWHASYQGVSNKEKRHPGPGQYRVPLCLKSSPQKGGDSMAIKIKLGKYFQFAFRIDKAVIFAILMLWC